MTLFVLLSVAFIIFSLNQSEDLVSKDYYDQGADYSKQMEVNNRSFIYKDSISVIQVNSTVDVNLCQSLASSGDSLFVFFYRPSDKKSDLKIKFPMTEHFSIPASQLKTGRYLVKISWHHLDSLYNIEKEIAIK